MTDIDELSALVSAIPYVQQKEPLFGQVGLVHC